MYDLDKLTKLEEEAYIKIKNDFYQLLKNYIKPEDANYLRTKLAEIETFHQQKFALFKLFKGVSDNRKKTELWVKIKGINSEIYKKSREFSNELSEIFRNNKASSVLRTVRALLKDVLNEESIIHLEQKLERRVVAARELRDSV